MAIGSDVNEHVGVAMYLNYRTNARVDIRLGAELTHFSNGASRLPNAGVNMGGGFVELTYRFNAKSVVNDPALKFTLPKYDKHFVSEILLTIS